jgi:hypothetical protein
MNLMRRVCWSLLFIILLPASVSLSVEVYRWTDEKGTVHFTDDPSRILKNHLDQTEKIQIPQENAEEVLRPTRPDDKSDRVKRYLKEVDAKIEAKRKIEGRISKLEEEFNLIEERLKRIDEHEKEYFQYHQPFQDSKTGKWAMVASPYYDEKRRLTDRQASIKKELSSLQEELSKINRSL